MRSRRITLGLLAALVSLGTGAGPSDPPKTVTAPGATSPVDGVWQAREWQHAGDMALANNQPLVAHIFYARVAKAFPGTPHGRYAHAYERATASQLSGPARSSASESPCSWVGEILDFVTWP